MAEANPSPSQTEDEHRLLSEDISNIEDAFGHDEIVEALTGAILAARPPFSIGLVGEWGVGKSFVLKKLEHRLKKENIKQEGVEVFYFDAWKYAGESIKRSLLERLFHERSLSDTKQGKEWLMRLYTTQQKPSRPVLGISRDLVLNRGLIPLAIGFGVYALFRWGIEYQPISAFATGAIVALLSLAVSVFNNITQVAWETFSIPPVASAEKFEEIFEEFLKEVLGKSENKRAVILIDELDRCDAKTRAEVLQGLRTYLQNKRCIYVVACAPKSLRQGSSDSASELPDEEFLRKLFNLTCWIDPQGEENLRRYAARCLKEAGFKTNAIDLKQIIVLGNTKNPRRIRHFLNTLYFALRVARAREKSGRIENKLVTSNDAFLAKILILRQDWPKAFNEIIREPRKLRQWTESESPDGVDSDLLLFLRGTDQFTVEDPRPFFAVTMGVATSDLKRDADLIEAVFKRDIETAKSIVTTKYQEDYRSWSEILFEELRQCKTLREDQLFINEMIVVCALFEYVPNNMQKEYIEVVCDFMESEHVRESLPAQNADIVLPLALKARPEMRLKLLKYYLRDFFRDGKINSPIDEAFEKYAKDVSQEIKDALNRNIIQTCQHIASSTPGDLHLLEAYKEWPTNEENIAYLVNPDIVRALMDTYPEPLSPELQEKLYEVVYRLRPAWNDEVKGKVTDMLFKPFPDEESQDKLLGAEKSLALDWIEKLLASDDPVIEPDKALRLFWQSFRNLTPSDDQPYNDKVNQMVKVALRLNPLPPAETLPDLRSILDHYVHSFTNQFPLLSNRLRSEPKFDQTEERLVAFLSNALIEEKDPAELKPDSASAFISALFSMGRWREIDQCLKHPGQSVDWDSLLITCTSLSMQYSQLNLEPLIDMVKEYGGDERLAFCKEFLSKVADWCPDLGISNNQRDTRLGQFLFEQAFQFMLNEIKARLAANYVKVLSDRVGGLTKANDDFVGWAKKIWDHFSHADKKLFLESLGYIARPSSEIRDMAKRFLEDLIPSDTNPESLVRLADELIDQFSDRANSLRATAIIFAHTKTKSGHLVEAINKLAKSFDPESIQLVEELRTMMA